MTVCRAVEKTGAKTIGFWQNKNGQGIITGQAKTGLFSVARQAGRLNELEMACRQSACKRFSEQKLPGKLFLNVHPSRCWKPPINRGAPCRCCASTGSHPARS